MHDNTQVRRARLANAISARLLATATQVKDEGLEVSDLRVWPLCEPSSGRRYTVVRIRTRSGIAGYGECGPVSDDQLSKARHIVAGRPASNYEVVRQQLISLPNLFPKPTTLPSRHTMTAALSARQRPCISQPVSRTSLFSRFLCLPQRPIVGCEPN